MYKILLTLYVITMLSCIDNLNPDIPYSPKLVLFAYILPNQNIIASVTKSISAFENNRNSALVDSVLITLYENKILIDTLEQKDSTIYLSHIKPKIGNVYKILVKDLSYQLPSIFSEEVRVSSPPQINKISLDSIGKVELSAQDSLRLLVNIDTIINNKYIAYSTRAFYYPENIGHNWNINQQYQCSEDKIADINIDVVLAYIGCFNEVHEISFETTNHNLQELDSIQVKLCNITDFSGEFINNIAFNGGFLFKGLFATDDEIPSNVNNGFGAVLTYSCSIKTILLK